jgi:pre-rRNA-processing protein IPI1
MDFVPELVLGAFLAPCLQHFCDLLSQAHRGRNIKSQSIGSLLKVRNWCWGAGVRAFGAEA